MGSTVTLTAVDVRPEALDDAANAAIAFADEWENRFSRFRPASELTRLNRAGGAKTYVSPEFLIVLDAAIDAFHRSGGLFDPSILPSLAALGYDRDFAAVETRGDNWTGGAPVAASGMIDMIEIDHRERSAALPAGCQLDFGGIAKGMFVDRLCDRFASWPGGCVSAGGDLRVWGEPPEGDHWVVGIEDPFDANQEICLISITRPEAAAVATSAINRRVWRNGAERLHHLIDPATGRPVLGRLCSATALAPDLATAEVAAKALFVSGGRGDPLKLADASTAAVVDVSSRLLVIQGRHSHACVVHPLDSASFAA